MRGTTVRIRCVAVGHPEHRIDQIEAALTVDRVARNNGQPLLGSQRLAGDHRRAAAIARATLIDSRALAASAARIEALGSIEERNDLYVREAPRLAQAVAQQVLSPDDAARIGCLVTTSCTGYGLPGWPVELQERLLLPADTVRVPLTEAGCAGGVVALTRAAEAVRLSGRPAAAVAVELCSLSFQPGGDEGDMTAALIFGDGCGAAFLEPGAGPGLEILDAASRLIPDSRDALGFQLTDHGLSPILARRLGKLLPEPTAQAIGELLARNGLTPSDVAAWLIHPGGAAILGHLAERLGIGDNRMRWSWQAMRANGNMSSAAIFDVLQRFMSDPCAPRGWTVVAAFGPGVAIELLLARTA
jgi:alkylresorcinol/alkylpyrone synthase